MIAADRTLAVLPGSGIREAFSWPTWATPLLAIAVLAPAFLLAAAIVIPAEDAVILYEYARNLATTGVITYGGATTPIEGATDFLWMVVLAALKRVGVDEFMAVLALNFAGAAVILWMFRRSRTQAAIALAGLIVTPFLYSALLGFSTLAFSVLYLIMLSAMMRRSRWFHLSVLILCLMRPDGVIWGLGPVLLNLLRQKSARALMREARRLTVQLIAPGLVYFLWRLWYFGELLPLPFLVKAGGERTLLIFFADSIMTVAGVAAPIVMTAVLAKRRKLILLVAVALLAAPVLFYSAIQLEQNIGDRFLAPMFFGALFMLRIDRRRLLLMQLLVALTFASQFGMTRTTINQVRTSKTETGFYIAKHLNGLRGSMLVTEAGRLAYYSGWKVEDSWGLNTPAFARRLITEAGLQQARYDLIVAHCYTGLQVAQGAAIPAPGPARDWTNLCHILHRHIVEGAYAIYLVPFVSRADEVRSAVLWPALQLWRPNNCVRYDVYAVRRDSPVAADLRKVLLRFETIEAPYGQGFYEPDVPLRDQLCPR